MGRQGQGVFDKLALPTLCKFNDASLHSFVHDQVSSTSVGSPALMFVWGIGGAPKHTIARYTMVNVRAGAWSRVATVSQTSHRSFPTLADS